MEDIHTRGALGGNAAQAGGGGTACGPEVVKTLSERQWPELRKETWRSRECQPRETAFQFRYLVMQKL